MARNATWSNSDGLVVGFGTHTEDNEVSSVYQSANGIVTVQAEYTLANLVDTFAQTNVKPQDVLIPRGSIIKSAIMHCLVTPDSSGDNATLDIGTWGAAHATPAADDVDGLVADATQAEIGTIGQASILDGPLIADSVAAVAGVGATSDSDVVICLSYETTAFTAGKIRLVVEYYPPSGSASRVLAN